MITPQPGLFMDLIPLAAALAAAMAIANLISDEELNEDYIIPAAFDPRVGPAVAKAVAEPPGLPVSPVSDNTKKATQWVAFLL